MPLDRTKLDEACRRADALSRRFAARSDVAPLLTEAQQYSRLSKKTRQNLASNYAYRGPKPQRKASSVGRQWKKFAGGGGYFAPKRADIDPATIALAMHLKASAPQLQHRLVPTTELGHKPPRRIPGPKQVRPNTNALGRGRRPPWTTPRVDADEDYVKWLAEVYKVAGKEYEPFFMWRIAFREGLSPEAAVKKSLRHDPKDELGSHVPKDVAKVVHQISRAKRGKLDAQSYGDGLSVVAALVAFLATASLSTIVTWGHDKITAAKDLVRVAATGKLGPRDVAQIRRAIDKLKAAEKASVEARRQRTPQLRYEPRFDSVDEEDTRPPDQSKKRPGSWKITKKSTQKTKAEIERQKKRDERKRIGDSVAESVFQLALVIAYMSVPALMLWKSDRLSRAESELQHAVMRADPQEKKVIEKALEKIEEVKARGDVDWKKVGRKAVGYGARATGRGLQGAGIATGVAGGIIGAPGAVPAAILKEWHAFPGHGMREAGKKLNKWGKSKTRGDAGFVGLPAHVHPLTGTLFGTTRPVIDLTAPGAVTGTYLGGSGSLAGTAVMALAYLIAAASTGYLIKKGYDWLTQKLDLMRLAKSGGKITAKDRVEITAAIEKLKLARARSEALKRGDADETIKIAAVRVGEKVFTGANHGLAYGKFIDDLNEEFGLSGGMLGAARQLNTIKSPELREAYDRAKTTRSRDLEDGFVTSTGRFVDRQEADKIARAASQRKPSSAKRRESTPEDWLISEDIKRKRGDAEDFKVGDKVIYSGHRGTITKVERNTVIVLQEDADAGKRPRTWTVQKGLVKRTDIQARGDFWKAPETGAPKTAMSATKPTTAASVATPTAAAPAAASGSALPAAAATQPPTRTQPSAPQPGSRAFWKANKPLTPKKGEKKAYAAAQKAAVQPYNEELAKHPQTRQGYRKQKAQWKEARKRYREHDKAYRAFETNVPPPGSAEAQYEAKRKAQPAKPGIAQRLGQAAGLARQQTPQTPQQVDQKALKKHRKQWASYERNDPPPGSVPWKKQHAKFGTTPSQPGEARAAVG